MSDEPTRSPDAPDLDLLIVECFERFESEGQGAVTELCARYPEQAEALRSAMGALADHGVAAVKPKPAKGFGVGSRIGDYELVGVVGRGGMGIVYEATDHQLNRTVAVKVLRAAVEIDDDAATRFRREAEIAGSLDHPGLVRVFSAGVHEGHPWLAMEFVAGRGLDEWIEELRSEGKGANWDVPRRVRLILEVAEALAPMHARGLVHRDVKPSNILVRDDGTCALGDFGLARRADDLGLTQSGAFAGTVHYASPEQASGESGKLSPASDVFSLGVTLYELLTLTKPFDGPTQRGVLDSIERREPVDPSKIVPGMAGDLGAVVMKALEKSPSARYHDAAAIAEDLRAYLEHRPVRARRVSRIGRVRRWVRREPMRAAFGLVVAVGLLVVAGLLGYSISQRPLVAEAERLRLQQRVDVAVLRGWIGLTMSNDAEASERAFRTALELEPSARVVLGLGLVTNLLHGEQAELELLDHWQARLPESRVLLRRRGGILAANYRQPEREREGKKLLAELGPPQESTEFFLLASLASTDAESNPGTASDDALDSMKEQLDAAMLGAERPLPEVYWSLGSSYYGVVGGPAAAAYARSVLRLWPDTGFAEALAGLALVTSDQATAVAHFERALKLDPSLQFVHGELADLHRMAGRLDDAEAVCRAGLESKPGDVACYRVLTAILDQRGDVDGAFEAIEASILAAGQSGLALSPSCALFVEMCRHYDRIEYGVERMRAHVKRVPDLPAIRLQLSRLAAEAGNTELAKATLDEWLDEYPPSAPVLSQRAGLAFQGGDYDAAITDLEAALKLAPGNQVLLTNLSSVHLSNGSVTEAVTVARRAARAANYRPMPLLRLARLEFQAGENEAGRHHLKMAREMLDAAEEPDTDASKLLAVLEGRHLGGDGGR